MATIIPVRENPNHTILINLDSITYKFWFLYNEAGEFWTISIYNEEDTLLISDVKIMPNYPLLFPYKNIELLKGDLYCEISDVSKSINFDNLTSGEAVLLYLSKEELQEI